MSEAFEHRRHARSLRTALIVAAVHAGLFTLALVFDASPWILAPLALVTVPALYDLWTDRVSGMRLDDKGLSWFSGRRKGALARDEIDRMRFDTRWDFSVRVTAQLTGGKPVRLPDECLPDHRALEAAFAARGIPVERHHFRVF